MADDAEPEPVPRGPGRPLDPEVDAAIVGCAAELLVTQGFPRLSIAAVATAAGVAKTTVYRRFPTTVELALAAIGHLNAQDQELDTGSAKDDLTTLLEQVRRRFDLSITGALLTEEREHPELLEAARGQMITPAVERFRRVLRAGVRRGELRDDLDLDLAAHALLGSFFVGYLEHGRPKPGWPARVVAGQWPALTATRTA